jgi:hypothetical protein
MKEFIPVVIVVGGESKIGMEIARYDANVVGDEVFVSIGADPRVVVDTSDGTYNVSDRVVTPLTEWHEN